MNQGWRCSPPFVCHPRRLITVARKTKGSDERPFACKEGPRRRRRRRSVAAAAAGSHKRSHARLNSRAQNQTRCDVTTATQNGRTRSNRVGPWRQEMSASRDVKENTREAGRGLDSGSKSSVGKPPNDSTVDWRAACRETSRCLFAALGQSAAIVIIFTFLWDAFHSKKGKLTRGPPLRIPKQMITMRMTFFAPRPSPTEN